MTRLEKALKEIPESETIKSGIEEGIKWADSNPNWHKYPDKEPGGYDEALPDYFLCIIEYNKVIRETSILTYISGYWWYHENDLSPIAGKVIAWMELPKYNGNRY